MITEYYLFALLAKDCRFCVHYKTNIRETLIKNANSIKGVTYKEFEADSLNTFATEINKLYPGILKVLKSTGIPHFSLIKKKELDNNLPIHILEYSVIITEKGEVIKNPAAVLSTNAILKWVKDNTQKKNVVLVKNGVTIDSKGYKNAKYKELPSKTVNYILYDDSSDDEINYF